MATMTVQVAGRQMCPQHRRAPSVADPTLPAFWTHVLTSHGTGPACQPRWMQRPGSLLDSLVPFNMIFTVLAARLKSPSRPCFQSLKCWAALTHHGMIWPGATGSHASCPDASRHCCTKTPLVVSCAESTGFYDALRFKIRRHGQCKSSSKMSETKTRAFQMN